MQKLSYSELKQLSGIKAWDLGVADCAELGQTRFGETALMNEKAYRAYHDGFNFACSFYSDPCLNCVVN